MAEDVETNAYTPAVYLQLLAEGWEVIESDGSRMTIQAPDDWEDDKRTKGERELIIDTDNLLLDYPLT